MSEPMPEYNTEEPATTTATHADVELVQSGYHELTDAYRHAVGTALHLQRLLGLPPADCLVIERRERAAYQQWRGNNGG